MLDCDPWARAFADPDPAQDRFQPNPVLIGGPQFDGGLWVGLLYGFYLLRKFFFRQGKSHVEAAAQRSSSEKRKASRL